VLIVNKERNLKNKMS